MADVSSGWGRLTWGQADWNDSTFIIQVGAPNAWGDSNWGVTLMKQLLLPAYQQQLL